MEKHIREIIEGLKGGRYSREASISQGIILRILHLLEWPTYDIDIVFPDYSAKNIRIDYALCCPPKSPVMFIQVSPGNIEKLGNTQLFENAFQLGVPIILITNGQRWKFYLSAEHVNYNDLHVYDLDFLKSSESKIIEILQRYLSYKDICSGKAFEAAKKDNRDVLMKKEIAISLSKTWSMLVNEKNDLLLELIGDEVETFCGLKPSHDQISNFLSNMTQSQQQVANSESRVIAQTNKSDLNYQKRKKPNFSKPSSLGFTLYGNQFPTKSAIDVLIGVFTEFNRLDSNFFQRFEALEKHGNTRRYLARSPEELFPNRPDMAKKNTHSREIVPGWWLEIHEGKINIEKIIKLACKVAHIRYGDNLIIDIGL